MMKTLEINEMEIRDTAKEILQILVDISGEDKESLLDRLEVDEFTYTSDAEELFCEELFQNYNLEILYSNQ